jgi:hypothetical protein
MPHRRARTPDYDTADSAFAPLAGEVTRVTERHGRTRYNG